MYEIDGTWFMLVSEVEIRDFVIQQLGFYAPSVRRKRTQTGTEYFNVKGLVFDNGKTTEAEIDLGYYGPILIDDDGNCSIDLEKIDKNLIAYRTFIHLVDEKNIGRVFLNKTYPAAVRDIYSYINKKINAEEDSQEKNK